MSSNEVLSDFVALGIMNKTDDDTLTRSWRMDSPNLALKAKAHVYEEEDEFVEVIGGDDEDIKCALHEKLALVSRRF